jgi:EF hand domain-containing protein
LRCPLIIIAVTWAGAAIAQPSSQPASPPIARSLFISNMDTEFRKMDADKNGQLTRMEIEQFQKLQAVAQSEARNRLLFTQLDTDRNGQLSAQEFSRFVNPPPPSNAGPMLGRMDLNRDNQIGLVEYRTATVANFDRLDSDKDGYVTSAESKAGGIPSR